MRSRKEAAGTDFGMVIDMRNLKIFSFFSGSGFLDLGFEKSGYDVDLVNEFSPAFIKTGICRR